MKKVSCLKSLFICFILMLSWNIPIFAQTNLDSQLVINDERDIPLDPIKQLPDKGGRSAFEPVYAYQKNNVIILDFMISLSNVSITLTNLTTNEKVYWDSFVSPARINIDINSCMVGVYSIDIISDEIHLKGQFTL